MYSSKYTGMVEWMGNGQGSAILTNLQDNAVMYSSKVYRDGGMDGKWSRISCPHSLLISRGGSRIFSTVGLFLGPHPLLTGHAHF